MTIPKEIKEKMDLISNEALHILAISGKGKDSKDTYERAQATLGMLDIAVRMLISEIESSKTGKSEPIEV